MGYPVLDERLALIKNSLLPMRFIKMKSGQERQIKKPDSDMA